jgi:hypothetical protein
VQVRVKVTLEAEVDSAPLGKGGGTLCPKFPFILCHRHPFSSKRATALAMLDVVTPTCRAISAIDNPNSSMPGVSPGIGKLVLAKRKARMGSNPATGEAVKIPAKAVVKMRVAKAAKEAILPGRK